MLADIGVTSSANKLERTPTMIRLLISVAIALLAQTCDAETTVFKCTKDGKVTYQAAPCKDGKNEPKSFADLSAPSITIWPNENGDYYTNITIEGKTLKGKIDTGATDLVIQNDIAKSINLPLRNARPVTLSTVNGTTSATWIDIPHVKIGSLEAFNVRAAIAPNNGLTLIGMSVLRQFDMKTENGALTLKRR